MSAYKVGDERNCRKCQQPIYFSGAHWWHKQTESSFCFVKGNNIDRAEPDLDEVERVRGAAPELLEALKSVMAGTYDARQHEGCTDCNFKRALAAIAKAEGK